MRLKQPAVRGPEIMKPIRAFRSFFALALPMLMIYSSPATAEYIFQLVIPPGAENAQTLGINNAGTVVGGTFDDSDSGYPFTYDMKKGVYTTISNEFGAIEISNSGVMVGNVDGVCAIRDKKGNVAEFLPPSFGADSFCQARGVNSKGQVSGFEIDAVGDFLGFIYDSKHGTYEEFLPSPQTIAQGINAQGQNVGSVALDADEAYPGSAPGRYGYLRQTDGSVKYFEISQSFPGQSRARGLSESGLISGFYLDPDTTEYKGYVTTLSKGNEFETITLTDDQVVHLSPCDPELATPEPGFVTLTDVFAAQVRDDGVVVGSCRDYHVNWTTGDFIVFPTYGFIATPHSSNAQECGEPRVRLGEVMAGFQAGLTGGAHTVTGLPEGFLVAAHDEPRRGFIGAALPPDDSLEQCDNDYILISEWFGCSIERADGTNVRTPKEAKDCVNSGWYGWLLDFSFQLDGNPVDHMQTGTKLGFFPLQSGGERRGAIFTAGFIVEPFSLEPGVHSTTLFLDWDDDRNGTVDRTTEWTRWFSIIDSATAAP